MIMTMLKVTLQEIIQLFLKNGKRRGEGKGEEKGGGERWLAKKKLDLKSAIGAVG